MERWQSTLSIDNEETLRIVYSDDYERVQENGVTHEFYYVGGNVILVRQTDKEDMVCYAITDNQGSVLCIVDKSGKKVFEAQYDAWDDAAVVTTQLALCIATQVMRCCRSSDSST